MECEKEDESFSKKLRKTIAFFVFALLVVSLVPVSLAAESSEDTGVIATNSEVNVESSDSGDSESGQSDSSVKIESRQKISVQERNENKMENRAEIRKDRMEINVGKRMDKIDDREDVMKERIEDRREKFADLRENQKEKLMVAVDICKKRTNDSEKCKDMFEKRISLIANLSEKDAERLALIQERREEKTGDLRETVKSRIFEKFDDKKEFKARVLPNVKIRVANENFLEAKANFSESKKRFNEERKELQDVNKEFKECRKSDSKSDSERCKEVNAQAKLHAIAGLESAADAMISSLQKIKAKVNESEDVTDNESAEIIAKLDAKITAIAMLKVKIEALNENSTNEEIRALAKELKSVWKDAEHEAKRHAGRVVSSKIGGIVVRLKHLEVKLERTLEKAIEQGKNTSEVESLVVEFNSELSLAQEKYKASVDAYLQAKTQEDMKKAASMLKEAREALNEAHKKLKEIFKELKDLRVEVESETEADIEAEAEESVNVNSEGSSSATATA